jgi:class 3 adenylate cyclase
MIGTPRLVTVADAALTVLERLHDPQPLHQAELLAIWKRPAPQSLMDHPEFYRGLAVRALKHGEPLVAYDIITDGLQRHPSDLRLKILLGHALERSGAYPAANLTFRKLYAEGQDDCEVVGCLGNSWRDLAIETAVSSERESLLRKALRCLETAYTAATSLGVTNRRAWYGISAASTAYLLGQNERARTLAREVIHLCEGAIGSEKFEGVETYPYYAAMAEGSLLCGKRKVAADLYAKAVSGAPGQLGEVVATRRRARVLLEHAGADLSILAASLPLPCVVAFAGHMIDREGRETPRFPASAQGAVRDAIVAELRSLDAAYGFSSAACGGDILFIEAMQDRDAEIHIILPYQSAEFRKQSIEVSHDDEWGTRFDRALSRATRVTTATDQKFAASAVTYEFTNMLVKGLATIRARQLDTHCCLLAVWDGRPGDGFGGTATTVETWKRLSHDVRIINLMDILNSSRSSINSHQSARRLPESSDPSIRAGASLPRKIVAALFADVVHFSQLTEEETEHFIQEFLGTIASFLTHTTLKPIVKNTWGDGLYFVFDSIEVAGQFALSLSKLIREIDWQALGLPARMSLRVAVHAGPSYEVMDPITGSITFTGSNVNRAARIEPITEPDEVYASQPFVALAAAYDVREFEWDYVGQLALAKDFGMEPIFRLREPRGRL